MKKFENDHLSLTVDEGAGCAVTFQVRVKPATCEAVYQKVLKDLRKKLSIPGFRKGKVPEHVVTQRFSDRVEARCLETVVQDAFTESAYLAKIFPWSSDAIEAPKVDHFARDAELELTYCFERTPDIPDIVREDLQLPDIPLEEVTSQAIDEHVAQMRQRYATFEEAEEVEAGGRVTCKIESLKSDEPELLAASQQLTLDPEQTPQWLIDGLLGQRMGSVVEPPPVEGQDPLRLTLDRVERPVLPGDAELVVAAKVESMEQLRERAEEHLRKNAQQRRQQARIEALWQRLLEQYPFDLPTSLFEEEKRSRVKRMVAHLREQKLPDEEMLAKEREIESAAAAEAEMALRTLFLSRKVVDDAEIEIAESDVIARTHSMLTWQALMAGQKPPQLDEELLASHYDQVRLQLIKEAAEEHLLEPIAA